MNNTLGIPRIGLTPVCHADGRRDYPKYYTDAIESVGAEVVPIDIDYPLYTLKAMAISLDAMVFSGGGDVNPRHYGQAAHPETAGINEKRDDFEMALFDLVWSRYIPILGICRGMQLVNVAMGGTLNQHVENHRISVDNYDARHEIDIVENTRLAGIMETTTIEVNSFHHQTVDQLGQGLIVSARAKDGSVEAIELPEDRFLMGVQWHPEMMLDDQYAQKLFKALRAAMH